mmetsp:Transcript_7296/g.12099  ORF Transcript_7296/g.12099 Transcript_7296/m.12099 type:complete len:106 (+) Transcript_7296:922-1239(+)
MVRLIESMDEYNDLLEISKTKLVVVDFFAVWCGPCKVIAPMFEQWQTEYPDVEFVKVDVDEADEVAATCGIRAMPTFHFYKDGAKLTEIQGANVPKIKELIEANK